MKKNISLQDKKNAITSYRNGNHTLRELGAIYDVHHSSIEKWIVLYESFGDDGLQRAERNRKYPRELKEEAVRTYLAGGRTMYQVCRQYGIRSISLLQSWILRIQLDENKEAEEE